MSFYSGTASNYIDLLKTIIDKMQLNGWTLIECNGNTVAPTSADLNLTPTDGSSEQNICYLQSVGIATTDRWQIRLSTYQNSSNGYYNFGMSGGKYNVAGNIAYQPGLYSGSRYATFWNNSINYDTNIDADRVCIKWRIGSSYYFMYIGGFDKGEVLSTQYLCPFIIIGQSKSSSTTYNTDAKSLSGTSNNVTLISNLNARISGHGSSTTVRLYPFKNVDDGRTYNGFLKLANNFGTVDGFSLRDIVIIYNSFIAGTLKGVWAVSSINNQNDSVITDPATGMQYLCFGQHNDLSNSKMLAISKENV